MLNNADFICLIKSIKVWILITILLYQRMPHLNFDAGKQNSSNTYFFNSLCV